MATAQELFALTNGVEEHIVIGTDRYITVPEPLKRIAVQFDHDVETVTFDCPRYWDDLDMSKMVIYINYKLPDGTLDAYPAKNIKAESDIMHFDWTISRNLTQYKGTITFLVCIKKTGADGEEVNHWNSELCTDMYVSEGMECQEQAQMEYSDLITQLLERMIVVENINVQAEEMQALHDETLEAASLAKDESNYIKNSYANAYKQSVSGEVIRVDDVSPLEHTVDVSVHSKNLCVLTNPIINSKRLSYDESTQTFTVVEAGFVQRIRTFDKPYPVGTKVAVTLQIESGQIHGTLSFGGYHLDTDGTSNWQGFVTAEQDVDLTGKVYTATFTSTDTITDVVLFVDGAATVNTSIVLKTQFEIGDEVTEYTPYIDPSTITLKRCGKAVFATSEYELNKGSGSWTSILMAKIKIGPGDYVASCNFNQVGTDISKVCLSARDYSDIRTNFGNAYSDAKSGVLTVQFTVEEGSEGFQLYLYSNHSENVLSTDCIFTNIMVEPGSEATGYESYTAEAYTPNVDGTVENVYSLYPTMTLFTDINDVIIDLTYNRDNNKVIGDISTALDALLAMQVDTMTLLDNMSGGTS